jgi:PAS domain S-box-containing protein
VSDPLPSDQPSPPGHPGAPTFTGPPGAAVHGDPADRPSRFAPLLFTLGVVGLTSIAGLVVHARMTDELSEDEAVELAAITRLRAGEVAEWYANGAQGGARPEAEARLAVLLRWPIDNRQVRLALVPPAGEPLLGPTAAPDRHLPIGEVLRRLGRSKAPELLEVGGRSILAVAVPIEGTSARLVACLDVADALHPLRSLSLALAIGGLAIALVTAGGGLLWWRLQQARLGRRREQVIAERATLLERIEILSRYSNDMMFLLDERQVLVDVNDRACEVTGYPREELLGMSVERLRDPATVKDLPLRTREEIERGGVIFETRYQRKDGSTFPVEVSVRTAVIGGRRFFQGISRDITERRRMELQLQLADRMASVGTLAAGVAHEINNPLAYVLANLDFALAELAAPGAGPEELARALGEAREGAVRVREIVRDLKSFSRVSEEEREPVDVRKVLQTAVGLAQNEIRHRARLAIEYGEVPSVMASEHRLGQVFLNLLINAAQAIPDGAADRNLVNAATFVGEDGRVAVEITDSGTGIPAEVLPRIFDPFFTTKPVGVGTGLGLSIAHGLVTELGGDLSVRSELGSGTIFTVRLPPAPAGAVRMPIAQPGAAPLAPGAARVLVVDDEPLVGRAVARILSPPHQVTVAVSGQEALDRLAQEPYDVVLCDLMMPGLTGMDVHQRLIEQAPALADRMIFLTGGAFTDSARSFLARVPNERLEKPFEPATLRQVVAKRLVPVA